MMNARSRRWTGVAASLMVGLLGGYLIAAGSLTSLLRSYGWLRQVVMLFLGVGA